MPTVELWKCKTCPVKIPDFIHPHITREGNEFIIEIYPRHLYLQQVITKVVDIQTILRKLGFAKAQHIVTTDESPNIDSDGNWIDCACHESSKFNMSLTEMLDSLENKGFGN